jgi:hypothetical protein
MGQSLASDVTVYLEKSIDVSNVPEATWKEIFVVSGVSIEEIDISQPLAEQIRATTSEGWVYSSDIATSEGKVIGHAVVRSPKQEKCARCWKYVVEEPEKPEKPGNQLGERDAHAPLCGRCTEVVAESTNT